MATPVDPPSQGSDRKPNDANTGSPSTWLFVSSNMDNLRRRYPTKWLLINVCLAILALAIPAYATLLLVQSHAVYYQLVMAWILALAGAGIASWSLSAFFQTADSDIPARDEKKVSDSTQSKCTPPDAENPNGPSHADNVADETTPKATQSPATRGG